MESKQFWLSSAEILFRFVYPTALGVATDQVRGAFGELESAYGVSFSTEFVNKAARLVAENATLQMVSGVTATTRAMFQDATVKWMDSGLPLQSLLDELAPIYGKTRAEAIGITEVTRIYVEGNRQAWMESSIVEGQEIETAMDELVCPICSPQQGKVYPLSASSSDLPPYHTRCRCWTKPKVKVGIGT